MFIIYLHSILESRVSNHRCGVGRCIGRLSSSRAKHDAMGRKAEPGKDDEFASHFQFFFMLNKLQSYIFIALLAFAQSLFIINEIMRGKN